jgi:uncharacterized membrane protein
MSVRLSLVLDQLRSRMWFIPGAFVVGALLVAILVVPLDRLADQAMGDPLSGILFAGGPDSARLVLSTIAAAMLTFTGLVYSVTMLVLQLASSQLSPRVMRTFLRDRVNQGVLGLFIATFLYALLVLREIRSPPNDPAFVPAIAVTLVYVLLVASVGAFVFYIHHMAEAIRAAHVLRSVADETRGAIGRLYPEEIGEEPSRAAPELPSRDAETVVDVERGPGVIVAVDEEALLRFARDQGVTIEVLHMVGDFVPTGAPLARFWRTPATPAGRELPTQTISRAIQIGGERTMTQDAAFGFRQIVDIAERALSTGTNDPTTAVQALDELHDLLRRLATLDLPSPIQLADDGSPLLRLPRPDWPDYVALALDEIRQYGAGSIQIARRLRYLLLDIKAVAPRHRQEPLDHQIRLLDAAIAARYDSPDDRLSAAEPSPSGMGPKAMVIGADEGQTPSSADVLTMPPSLESSLSITRNHECS